MNRVLITGIGGDIAQAVAALVRSARPGARLFGSDVHDRHGGTLYADECLIVPPASDPGYGRALRSLVARHGIDLVIPLTEAEIGAMPEALGNPPAVSWIGPGPEVIAAGLDKLATAQALARLDLPVPWTCPVNGGPPQAYPCLLKPRRGSGSRGIIVIGNARQARCLAEMYPEAIFQELLEPSDAEVTCAVYRTRDGRIATLQLLRRLAGGFTGWARVIRDDAVDAMCAAIARGLRLSGSMNVQLRLTAAGPRVFEINPRFSSTVSMRHLLGFTDVVWTLDELDGREVHPQSVPLGRVAVRMQSAALLQ